MAHFYGSMIGSRQTVTSRCGTKKSGIFTHVRGWNFGIEVKMHHKDGKDIANVSLTSGSNGSIPSRFLGSFTLDDLNQNDKD